MALHKITEFYTEWFSIYPNIISKFRTIAIFKNCVKQNNETIKLIGMFMISSYTKVHLCKCNGSWVVSTKKIRILTFKRPPCSYFFHKNGLIKSCSSFEDLSVYKISWSHVDRCKFCIHLGSLNVLNFGMFEGTGLKSMASRSPSMAWPPYWIS
jgi:hypothetical protein